MTGLDVDARHIRDAIERDLAGYHAPADLPERARLGGRRRARRTRVRRVAGAAAVACAVAVAVVAVVAAGPQAGPGPAASAGLPSARSVGKAMLTAFGSVSGDILSSTEVDTSHGTVVDTYQDWNWPGQPAPGQLARWREISAENGPGPAASLHRVEDFGVSYASPPVTATGLAQVQTKVPARVTMVCYAGASGGCGMGNRNVPAGTWSEFSRQFTALDVSSGVGAGGLFSPAVLARGIAQGQWRVERGTRLDGQQAIVLRETPTGPIYSKSLLLWVNARTWLPLKYTADLGNGAISSVVFGYLSPSAANLALLRPSIPAGYPRSAPTAG